MRYIRFLFSFEVFFTLWLFSYQYKNAHEVLRSPDITLLLTVLLIPWGTILYFRTKFTRRTKFFSSINVAFLVMSAWFILASFWSPSHDYKMQKTLCYVVYTIPSFLMGYLVISQDEARVTRLLITFFIFSFLILIECLQTFWSKGLVSIVDVLNTNYLVTGQTLVTGLSVLMAWSFFKFAPANDLQKLNFLSSWVKAMQTPWFLALFLSSLYIYVLLNLGGRGPLIAIILALGYFYGLSCWRYTTALKPLSHLGIFMLLCGMSYLTLNGLFDHTSSHFVRRLAPMLVGQVDESLNERFSYYQSALAAFRQHPLMGTGLGGWPIFQGLGDIALHPHNIFLEILAETGVVGFVLFTIFLFLSLKHFDRNFLFSHVSHTAIALIALSSFLNALKTGDLHDNTLLFFSLSLCAGLKSFIRAPA